MTKLTALTVKRGPGPMGVARAAMLVAATTLAGCGGGQEAEPALGPLPAAVTADNASTPTAAVDAAGGEQGSSTVADLSATSGDATPGASASVVRDAQASTAPSSQPEVTAGVSSVADPVPAPSLSTVANVQNPSVSVVQPTTGDPKTTLPDATPVVSADATDKPGSRDAAARFLARATFGPTDADVARVTAIGYGAWIDEQVAKTPALVRRYVESAQAATGKIGKGTVFNGIWSGMLSDPAQLRQRVAFALSEIFVISLVDGGVHSEPRSAASYYDMLAQKGLGNYRDLLQGVALHPMMGQYLSHRGNQKADPATGRVPDENFAREVMQLFSIGLYQLNADGTLRRDGAGKPIETYGPDDVAGLAKVFTGWSWYCPAGPTESCFRGTSPRYTGDANSDIKPLVGFPQYHSTEEKRFLGVTIAPQTTPNPDASLRVALDTLFNHPNTAPFISRQLIQRLVTSNPSPRYVADVASKFVNNGAGVRGDMAAVVRAILLHPEASVLSSTSGKVREPILRLTAFLRAFPFSSVSGGYWIGDTDSASLQLEQTPMNAASVFNFFRPGFAPPGSQAQAMGLVAPEMQLVDDTSAAGFVYFMRKTIDGAAVGVGSVATRDVRFDLASELALATNPAALMSRISSRLTYGTMSTALQSEVSGILDRMPIPTLASNGSNLAAVNDAKRRRVNAALLLTVASPEFIVQK